MLCCLTVLSGESHCEHTLCCAEVALCIWHLCCAELCCMCGMHAVLRCIKQQSKDADQPCPALYKSCLKRYRAQTVRNGVTGAPVHHCQHSNPGCRTVLAFKSLQSIRQHVALLCCVCIHLLRLIMNCDIPASCCMPGGVSLWH